MEADKIRKLALARLGEHTPNERPGPCGGRTDSPSLRGSEGSFGESVLSEADQTKLDSWRTLGIWPALYSRIWLKVVQELFCLPFCCTGMEEYPLQG